jgi:CCR4-NOT complex subunit CAF16
MGGGKMCDQGTAISQPRNASFWPDGQVGVVTGVPASPTHKRKSESAEDGAMSDSLTTIVDEELPLKVSELTYCYGGGATIHDRALSEPKLIDVNCSFQPGCRVLVTGANGAGKSTLLSLMGGKKMVQNGACKLFGKDAFKDTSLNRVRMYCGDWWRTNFFFNITVAELVGEKLLSSPRVQELIDIMQINMSWRINAISDGQRRRCQLLECLAEEKKIYVLDEITTDLDLYARENLLGFLRRETEEKGATVFYATHIFDSLADWATHVLHFSQAKVARCCKMDDLHEYHERVSNGTRCPLYALMKDWVFREYDAPAAIDRETDAPPAPIPDGPTLSVTNLNFSYFGAGASPDVKGVSFAFERGARILVVGANGACKSTVMSILGGKRMIPRGFAKVLGKDCFNDPAVSREVMYCGDWWRTNFFMNLTITELLGDKIVGTSRCQHLADVLQVDMSWKINNISDGQRRRCQLLEILAPPRPVYLMDEITSDLDIFAREGILNFLRAESELRGCTVFYCTHIFDHLEGWASHLLHLSKGQVVRACPMSEVEEYSKLCSEGNSTPLYTVIRGWIYSEYDGSNDAKPWRTVDEESLRDGRVPNLGLAGPFQTGSG